MDSDQLIQLVPHYIAMLLLAIVVVELVGILFGDPGFWLELVVIAVVVFSYRPVVVHLGIGPDTWEG